MTKRYSGTKSHHGQIYDEDCYAVLGISYVRFWESMMRSSGMRDDKNAVRSCRSLISLDSMERAKRASEREGLAELEAFRAQGLRVYRNGKELAS